ncbi:hypothetical protein M9Y10_028684 [Tritrichomonas musculus]|uniref:Ankyrin repeat protein n=1 Tax=Tritrichomonas musculus TaxID=1915356 RepID=A0ABR2KK15_9EUKA
MSGSPKVAKIFFEILNKIDLYKLNKQNKTGIYYLVGKKTKNVIKILKILLEKGYDINFKPNGGNSILTDFVFHFNPDLEVIEFLLQNGANARIMTTQNKTLYERIEESINNQLFYTQSQNQIKLKIFQLFERYSQLNKEEEEEEEEEEEAIKEELNNDNTDANYNNEVENKE